jgi:hypothetical protein
MDRFELNLESIEEELTETTNQKIILGFLDGSIPGSEWIKELDSGNVVVLQVKGDLEELVHDIAPEIKQKGGSIVHFRGFLILAPPGIFVDNERLLKQ